MKKFVGPLISICTLLLFILVVEVFLAIVAPVPDPYRRFKDVSMGVNQYIKSEFPPNYRFATEVEKGLPGMHGKNMFSVNNMGFRGDDLRMPKPENEFRIFIVGGSSAECMYIDDSQSIEILLQNELNGYAQGNPIIRVYNAGKSGDASDDHISMIVHRIVHLEPDLLILFCGINDLTRSIYEYDYLHYKKRQTEKSYSGLRYFWTKFQILRRCYYLVKRYKPNDTDILEDIPAKSNNKQKVQLRKSKPVTEKKPQVNLKAYDNNLKTLIGIAVTHSFQLLLVTQQTTWNSTVDDSVKEWHWMLYRNGKTYSEKFMNDALESLNDVMRRLTHEHGVPLFDLTKKIPKSREYFYDDVHFNIQGAQKFSKELGSFIVHQNLIFCE